MAIKRLQKFMHKENQYYLMADVKTFFPSIDKNILFALLSKHIKINKGNLPRRKRIHIKPFEINYFPRPY